MKLEQDKRWENVGAKLGYLLGFVVFPIALFCVHALAMWVMDKPLSWNFWYVAATTTTIGIVAYLVRRWLA